MNGDDQNWKVLCDIAQSAFEAVERLLRRDQALAGELLSSATSSRQIYREEPLTVEMAATLRERFPNHVTIALFTTREEAHNGADWYWRFERDNRAIHARVKAKRVRRNHLGGPDSDGSIEVNREQLKSSWRGRIPSPAYRLGWQLMPG